MLFHVRHVLLFQHADRGGRAEHRLDAILGDNLPPDRRIGTDRQALVHNRRRAVQKRSVDDVRVADDPADVTRREHRLAGLDAKNAPHRRRKRDRVAAGVALDAFRIARGSRRVEDVRRLGRFEPLAGHARVHVLGAQRGVVDIATLGARHRGVETTIDDDDRLRRMARKPDRFVDERLVANRLAAAHAGVGGEEHLGLGVVDARGERCGGEPAEYDGVDRADARAREHRERGFRDHRHVDQHAVAATHAFRPQHGGAAIHFGVKLGVRVTRRCGGFGRQVDERRLVRARRQMTIDGVMAQVRAPADEPTRERRLRIVEDLLERRLPLDQRRFIPPERVAIVDRPGVKISIGRHCCNPER